MTVRWTLAGMLLLAGLQPCAAQAVNCGGAWTPDRLLSTEVAPAPGAGPTITYWQWEPRVIDWKATMPSTLTVVAAGFPSKVLFAPAIGGPVVELQPIAVDTFTAVIPAAQILDGYRSGLLHNYAGKLQLTVGNIVVQSASVFVNVRDTHVPDVAIASLGGDAQAALHVVNLRRDEPWLGPGSSYPLDATQRLYELYADVFDFLALVGDGGMVINSFYLGVRNDVEGIGIPRLDQGERFGSGERLQGVINFPTSTLFDLGGQIASHEIGHRWINFLDEVPLLAPGVAHWPISTLAYGMMGRSGPLGEGIHFPYRVTELPSGDYELDLIRPADGFNDFELYLMGLLDSKSVAPGLVFVDQDQLVRDGAILHGPAEPISAQDIVDAVGPRIPAVGSSQTEFHLAAIILSKGRLLSPAEMAFFDHMAARGEARGRIRYSAAFGERMVRSFHLATGGRATLTTTLP